MLTYNFLLCRCIVLLCCAQSFALQMHLLLCCIQSFALQMHFYYFVSRGRPAHIYSESNAKSSLLRQSYATSKKYDCLKKVEVHLLGSMDHILVHQLQTQLSITVHAKHRLFCIYWSLFVFWPLLLMSIQCSTQYSLELHYFIKCLSTHPVSLQQITSTWVDFSLLKINVNLF